MLAGQRGQVAQQLQGGLVHRRLVRGRRPMRGRRLVGGGPGRRYPPAAGGRGGNRGHGVPPTPIPRRTPPGRSTPENGKWATHDGHDTRSYTHRGAHVLSTTTTQQGSASSFL